MKSILLATTILLGISGAASAADAVATEPAPATLPVASSYNWTGLYIGAQAGYEWARTRYDFTIGVPNGSFTPSGFVGGIYAGYNRQFDMRLVLGLEGDFEYSNVKDTFDNPFGGFSGGSADLRWQGSARLRIGYAVDRFLPYVTGGVAFGNFRFEGGPGVSSPFVPALVPWKKTMTGWTIGTGVEYALTDKWSARVEYRYTDFGKAHSDLGPAYAGVTETMKVRDHAVRVGISYKF